MHNDLVIIFIVATLLAIEFDKRTNFTHPGLHVAAIASFLGLMYSIFLVA